MKKNLRRQRTLQVLPAAIALSLGVIAPFAPPQCAFAAETQTQSDGGAHYISASGFGGQGMFKDISASEMIKPTKINNLDISFVLSGLNDTLVDFNKYDATQLKINFNTMKNIFNSNGNAYGHAKLPELKDTNGNIGKANAIVVKYFDEASGEHKYKVYSAFDSGVNNTAVGYTATNFLNWINEGLKSAAIQTEICQNINDKDGLKNVMEKYLPELYFVKLTDEKLSGIVSFLKTVKTDITNTVTDIDADVISDNLIAIDIRWGMETSQSSSSDASYSYDTKTVASGEIWRPTDRAVNITLAYTGDYKIPKYWVTGQDGTKAADDLDSGHLKPDKNTEVGTTITDEEIKPIDQNAVTAITVKELTTGTNSVIDLSYINTSGLIPSVTLGDRIDTGMTDEKGRKVYVSLNRYLIADKAVLGNDTTFRLGVYNKSGDSTGTLRINDAVFIKKTDNLASNTRTNINVQLGYVPEIGEGKPFGCWINTEPENVLGSINIYNGLLSIYDGSENFEVTGLKSVADGIFSMYEITPDVGRYDNYFKTDNSKEVYDHDAEGNYYCRDNNVRALLLDDQGKPWRPEGSSGNLTNKDRAYLAAHQAIVTGYSDLQGTIWYLKGYSWEDTGEMAESGKSISENSTVQNNFVKANNLSLFRRSENLHGGRLNRQEAGGNGPQHDESGLAGELRENLWADVWHGKFDAKAAYARSTNQSYNGFQVGYDKLLSKKFYGGKVYTGFYASKIDGKSTTYNGKGEQDSYGVGVYSSWVGDKGHFIDLGVNAFKLKNDYHFIGNTGDGSIGKVKGENSTWAYGIGAQYGKRNELSSNWFWEPSVSLYVGHVDESSYSLSNGLGVHEQGYDTAIGKLGLKAGKNIGDKGNLYAGVSWGHEFAGGQKLHQSYGAQSRLVETVGGSDSWWEWNVGGKVKLSPNAALNLDFIKTTGSDVGNEWSINGGLDFSWGGFGSGGSKAAKVNASGGEPSVSGGGFAKANAPTVVVGQAPKVGNVQVPQMQQSVAVESGSADSRAVYDMGEAGSSVVRDDTGSVSGTVTGGMGEFELGGLTVEAKRPDWEKNLSPGQVSVIYPAQFEGEQKNLPELLDRVPGLFIQQVNGAGHYTVARVRGSTAAQVSVYVDGVQMNLTGDAAVNLSAIPADNIERIEVYRGYVPARFAGAPLGGVINIITKKPNEGHGHITQGVKSYGGYSSTYEYSMPLGSGSLLATYARDIWQGDFDFIYPEYDNADKTFERRSNSYQNNNAMLKWQDDNWVVKGVWKKQHEGLAKAIAQRNDLRYLETGYLDGDLDIDYKEFMVARRDTFGNLDLGWHVAYLDSKKTYTNVGGYKQISDTDSGLIDDKGQIATKTKDDFLPGQLWGTYHSKKWNGNLNAAIKAGNNHLLEFNGDFTRETMNANGNNWDLTQERLDNQTGANRTVRKMLSKYNNREYHLTLQDTITLNDDGDFKLTPILRADKVEMEGLGNLGDDDSRWMYSGGVALQKQINDHWSFKSTWGTYNRHPNFYEVFGDGGFISQNYVFTLERQHDFKGAIDNGLWETGEQFDFSLNWQGKLAGADTDTILTYYQRKANNQLVLWTPRLGGGMSCYCPTGDTETYGLELAHNMKWRRLNLALAATWQKSKEVGEKLNLNWAPSGSSFVPEWVVSARLDYLFPGDKLNVFGEYRYTGQEVLRGTSSDGSDASDIKRSYSIVDLGIKYKFNKSWRLSAGVNDVFDKGKEVFIDSNTFYGPVTPAYYPLAGRMYYTTLEYSF